MTAIERLKETKLMVLARGIEKDVLVKAVGAIADAGVTVFESTFDHRREDCIAENADLRRAHVDWRGNGSHHR